MIRRALGLSLVLVVVGLAGVADGQSLPLLPRAQVGDAANHPEVVIRIAATGIAAPRFRNLLAPPYILGDPRVDNQKLQVSFLNTTDTRIVRVKLGGLRLRDRDIVLSTIRGDKTTSYLGIELTCTMPADSIVPECTAAMDTQPRARAEFPVALLLPQPPEMDLTEALVATRTTAAASRDAPGLQLTRAPTSVMCDGSATSTALKVGSALRTVSGAPINGATSFIATIRDILKTTVKAHSGMQTQIDLGFTNTEQGVATEGCAGVSLGALVEAAAALDAGIKNTVIRFMVEFANEGTFPTFSRGAFSLESTYSGDGSMQDPTSMYSTGSFGLRYDPVVQKTPDSGRPEVSEALPLLKPDNSHMPVKGQIGFRQHYGDRADADILFAYANVDLGETTKELKSVTLSPSVERFIVNVRSRKGSTLSFGRMEVAVPSGGLAINEKGDAVRLSFLGNFSMALLVKREGRPDALDPGNEDNKELVLQAESLTLGQSTFYGGIVIGRDQALSSRHDYVTVGGEVVYDFGRDGGLWGARAHEAGESERGWRTSLTGALYYSRKWNASSAGTGLVGLGTVAFVNYPKTPGKGVRAVETTTVLATFGKGSGDDPETSRNEGYIGETPGFAPDQLFLKSLATPANTSNHGQVGSGLANKQFYSISVATPAKLLQKIAGTVFGSVADDHKAETLTMAYRYYRFNQAVNGQKVAGSELDLTWQLTNTSKVSPGITAAVFLPGQALKPMIPSHAAWSIAATVGFSFNK